MDYLIPILGGITAKLYDDCVDNNIQISETCKECLKGIQWITLTLMAINDFNFSIFFYLIVFLNYLVNQNAYNKPYEFSLLIICPLLLLLNIKLLKFDNFKLNSFKFKDILNLLLLISYIIWMVVEPFLFPEEISFKKMIFRSITLIVILIQILLFESILYDLFTKINLYAIGYFLLSIFFHIYIIFIKPNYFL